jgi:hypothetical protein
MKIIAKPFRTWLFTGLSLIFLSALLTQRAGGAAKPAPAPTPRPMILPNEQFISETSNAFAVAMMTLVALPTKPQNPTSEFNYTFKALTTQVLKRYPCLNQDDAMNLLGWETLFIVSEYLPPQGPDPTLGVSKPISDYQNMVRNFLTEPGSVLSCVNSQ